MDPDSGNILEKGPPVPPREKHCLFHKRAGHELTECKAFNKLTVKEREQWIMGERLCFRCFSPHHVASTCKENVKCSICGSRRHPDLLHLSTESKRRRRDLKKRRQLTRPKETLMLNARRYVRVPPTDFPAAR